MGPTKFTLKDGTLIDVGSDSGIFQFDRRLEIYTPAGRATTKINRGAFMTGLLGGFRLEPSSSLGQKVVSIRKLEEMRDTIEEGRSFTIYFSGTSYTATKDSSIRFTMVSTLNRHLKEVLERHIRGVKI